ncbi:hypothetical protein [Acinetobacter sp. YH12085]|uniref:hypothetical protein n=1 Tax=Acinetobacter sp. YH12085 TaxID=2601077 RepID=UPI0015D287FE|nr:hypothetical protein [Acinetobacter sp. YH12085]
MHQTQFQDPKHKIIALYYGFFALLGMVILGNQLLSIQLSLLVLIIILVLYVQLFFMLMGAIKYWKRDVLGLKILFWISLSLVPIIITPLVIYYPKVTTGFFLFMQNSFGFSSTGFEFHVAYDTQLTLLNTSFWGIGINLIEFFLWLRFKNIAANNHISIAHFKNEDLELKRYD